MKDIAAELGNPHVLEGLLRRRYFSRIWVIQEIALAPLSIFPIGQVDFYANSDTPNELLELLGCDQWNMTTASWLQYMHNVAKFDGQDLFQTLQRISVLMMDTTDPRDKIFGVLGLLQGSASGAPVPEYSLSVQNVIIGTVAHFLLDLKRDEILRYAAGRNATASFPSWVPAWDDIWHPPAEGFELPVQTVEGIALEHGPQAKSLVELRIWEKHLPEGDIDGSGPPCKWRNWSENASIRRSDGALCIDVLHLMAVNSAPEPIVESHEPGEVRKWTRYSFRRGRCSVIISVSHPALERIIGNEEPTSLCTVTGPKRMALAVLQPLQGDNYRLIAWTYCQSVEIISPQQPFIKGSPAEWLIPSGAHWTSSVAPWQTFEYLSHQWREFNRNRLSWSLFKKRSNSELQLFDNRELPLFMRLRLFQSLLALENGEIQLTKFAHVLHEFAQEVCGDLFPSIRDESLVYITSPEKAASLTKAIPGSTIEEDRDWCSSHLSQETSTRVVTWSCTLIRVMWILWDVVDYGWMRMFSGYKYATGEDEMTMMLREPRPEDNKIYPKIWPDDIAEELGLDAMPRRVCIV
ncbi:hypothetical protein PG991_013090 [Apiospora marii]|uniref:Heterokaryon incompatibility domain-containing protein n=1 Tax=Apiospora marii TaxID=335849 RepID=A0ABR1R583_9PEZI